MHTSRTTPWARPAALALAALLALADAVLAQQVERRLPLAADGSVKVWALGGSVRVMGWSRDSVLVRGSVAGGASLFHIGGSPTAVKMFVEDRDGSAGDSHLEVWVPARAKVWVKTESAMIDVRGVEGSVDLNTIGGAVQVSGMLRDLYAESMDGRIALAVTAPSVRAKTASGDLTFEGGGDNVRLTTVSGTIAVAVDSIERARCESVTGAITVRGGLARGASLALESHSGQIELIVPPATSADFDIDTFGGTIDNRLTRARPTELERRGRSLAFTAGDGGAEVQIRNFKGAVILRPR